MRTPEKIDAIRLLVGGGVSGSGDGSNIVFHEGQTPPTEEAIQAKLTALQADYDSKQYQRDRKYPSVGDQLDMIMKDMRDGTKTHQIACEAVKKEFPKP